MSQIDTYLFFDGTCAQAMQFYERTLDGKLEVMMTNAQAPGAEQMPAQSADRILHARLNLDGRLLMASDSMVGQPYPGMHGFHMSLVYPTVVEAQRIFDALAEGGQVNMPFQATFWAKGFGMLVDRYGTPWMVNGEQQKI
jgi:PhnB protein